MPTIGHQWNRSCSRSTCDLLVCAWILPPTQPYPIRQDSPWSLAWLRYSRPSLLLHYEDYVAHQRICKTLAEWTVLDLYKRLPWAVTYRSSMYKALILIAVKRVLVPKTHYFGIYPSSILGIIRLP